MSWTSCPRRAPPRRHSYRVARPPGACAPRDVILSSRGAAQLVQAIGHADHQRARYLDLALLREPDYWNGEPPLPCLIPVYPGRPIRAYIGSSPAAVVNWATRPLPSPVTVAALFLWTRAAGSKNPPAGGPMTTSTFASSAVWDDNSFSAKRSRPCDARRSARCHFAGYLIKPFDNPWICEAGASGSAIAT